MSDIIYFDYAIFQAQFPVYASSPIEAVLQGYWDKATCYISDLDQGILSGGCRRYALNLLTAHYAYISPLIAEGQTLTIMKGASIDKVSITVEPPKSPDALYYWYNTSPYGIELLALLTSKSAGGYYVGGLPETQAFRKFNGVF